MTVIGKQSMGLQDGISRLGVEERRRLETKSFEVSREA